MVRQVIEVAVFDRWDTDDFCSWEWLETKGYELQFVDRGEVKAGEVALYKNRTGEAGVNRQEYSLYSYWFADDDRNTAMLFKMMFGGK
jgi:hypothetical protein